MGDLLRFGHVQDARDSDYAIVRVRFSGTTRILARIRYRLTKNAIQKTTATTAVAMNRRGETSNDVS